MQMRIEAMKSEEKMLNRELLYKIKMDREREQRILAMHRQTEILEEEIKKDRQRQELPSIRYDPNINIKAERNNNRQQSVDAEQIERNSNRQINEDQRIRQTEKDKRIEKLEDELNQLGCKVKSQEDERVFMLEGLNQLRCKVKSQEDEQIVMLESKQEQSLQKVKSQAEELERKREEMEKLEIEIRNERVTDSRINDEREINEAEIERLEEERKQLL